MNAYADVAGAAIRERSDTHRDHAIEILRRVGHAIEIGDLDRAAAHATDAARWLSAAAAHRAAASVARTAIERLDRSRLADPEETR